MLAEWPHSPKERVPMLETIPVRVLSFIGAAGLLCSGAAAALAAEAASPAEAAAPLTRESSKSVGVAASEAPPEPFAWGDFTWLNGNNRQHSALLDSKYFTGSFLTDVNYVWHFAHPKDHTIVGSTATFRAGEFNLSFLGFGGDFHWDNVRGRLMMQFGTRAMGIARNDPSADRGQFDLRDSLRYISEAYGGYHWDVLHGINLDVGLFMSYVGLFSYDNFENWAYQPSYTSDNTPWFFHGARLQIFPTDRLKVELWLINGWQSYAQFNNMPGAGYQIAYRPMESLAFVFNGYGGWDTPPLTAAGDQKGRLRVHSDNSVNVRYYNKPGAMFSKAAFSLTADLGFESGAGVTPFSGVTPTGNATSTTACGGAGQRACTQNFVAAMLYNRFWFLKDKFATTLGGGFIHNPGRYLVLPPTGSANPYGPSPNAFTLNPGDSFDAWDCSAGVQIMPSEYVTFVLEYVHRHANVPYFAGQGGVTSATGYYPSNPASNGDPAYVPDLRNDENRVNFAMLTRF
jgi:hypothetical protein